MTQRFSESDVWPGPGTRTCAKCLLLLSEFEFVYSVQKTGLAGGGKAGVAKNEAAVGSDLRETGSALRGPARATRGVSALGSALAIAMLRQAAEAIVACDIDGRIILVNDAARRLARCDIEGMSLGEAASVWGDLFEGGRRLAEAETPLQRALLGEVQVGREVQIVRHDGFVQTLLISAAPVRVDGAIVAAISNLSEITEFRRSEERYRALIESLPIGVLRSTVGGDIVDANDAFLEMVRFSREEMEAGLVRWRDLTPAEYFARDEAAIAEAIADGRCTPYEKAYLRKDGTVFPILIGSSMIGARKDEAIAFILDLSERQAAERAVRESEQQLRNLLDSLFAFVGILDIDGILLWANRAPLEAAGLTLDDVRGKAFEEAYWWCYDPQVQARIAAAIARAAQGASSRCDIGARMVGGSIMTIDFLIAPLCNAEGVIINLVASAVDVTERKAAEEALRESEGRLHLAQDAGGIGVWDWDVVTDHAVWSDSFFRLLGLEPKPGPQRVETFFAALHPDDRDRVAGEVEEALAGGSYRSQYRVVDAGGEVHWLAAQGEIKKDAVGRPVRMIGVAYDVTAQRSLLRQKEIMLREVNHRVKNSLQLVSSLLGLQHSTAEDESLRSQLAEADRRILTIAKIHEHLYRGVDPLNTIEFAGYLGDLCRELEETLAGPGKIAIEVDADSADLPTDQVISLALIVNELVTNATKYAFDEGKGGRIDVCFRKDTTGGCRLIVADDGRGLPADYRLDASPGLGMKVVSGLARSMRAELAFDSAGAGARFTISLPGSSCNA